MDRKIIVNVNPGVYVKKKNFNIMEVKRENEIINIIPDICGISGYCNCNK